MTWITIKLMKYHLWVAKRKQKKVKNDIVSRAYDKLIENYNYTIMFLKANS